MKEINEEKNYVIEEIKQDELISKKNKMVLKTLNYTEHLLILASTIYVLISVFAFLVGIPVGDVISSIWIKICALTARIEKYK